MVHLRWHIKIFFCLIGRVNCMIIFCNGHEAKISNSNPNLARYWTIQLSVMLPV